MYCRKCGCELQIGGQYCHKCGSKVDILHSTNSQYAKNKRNPIKKLVFVLGCVLMIVFTTGIVMNLYSGNATLAGTWVCEISVDGYPDGLVLYTDGVGIVDGYDCDWYVEDGNLYLENISISNEKTDNQNIVTYFDNGDIFFLMHTGCSGRTIHDCYRLHLQRC